MNRTTFIYTMTQTTPPQHKVRFNITPEQAAAKTNKWPGYHKKFSTLVENEHLQERVHNMDRRHQRHLTEKEQFCKWAVSSNAHISKLQELLDNQTRRILQLEEKLEPERHKKASETPAETRT